MGDDLYKLIPEEGKHLAESRNTKGAYRGVYLDDETNKPSGAGEFVKVNPEELNNEAAVQANSNEETIQKNNTIDAEQGNNDTNAVQDTKASSDVNGYVAIATAMFGLGILVANAYPHAKKWVKETAVPSAKSLWNKVRGKGTSISLKTSEKEFVEESADGTALSVDVAFNEDRENMTSEDAQRELIEAFILYLESMRRVQRVTNANVIDSDGRITGGKELLEAMANKGMIESINEILQHNPALLNSEQEKFLFDILGYEIYSQNEYIPITVASLTTGLFNVG